MAIDNSEEKRVQDLLIAMGHRKDQVIAVPRRMSDWVPVINIGQRRKIKERFKVMREEIDSKDAIIDQLRERLDRAKREQR